MVLGGVLISMVLRSTLENSSSRPGSQGRLSSGRYPLTYSKIAWALGTLLATMMKTGGVLDAFQSWAVSM